MSQPTPYNRVFSFTNDQTANPSTKTPGNQLDSEYNAILTSISQILANLVLIQRDDGQLANQTVGAAQLKPEITSGVQPATIWATATSYGVNATVFSGLKLYRCLVAHISGAFATDLAAGHWTLLADFTTAIAAANNGVLSIGTQIGALTIAGGDMSSTVLPVARYDAAQTLTAPQELQLCNNIQALYIAGSQTLNATQQLQAANNILAPSGAGAQTLSTGQKAQVNTNAGALSIANNLSEITNTNTAQKSIGLAGALQNHLSGLILSTAGASTTFSVAAGVAADSTNVDFLTLASVLAKTTGAWTVGGSNGALDTGAIANSTWYHVWLIKRVDTQVVDVLASLSATTPTMPTNYTLKRRIGSMKTNGSGQWTKFVQFGDRFVWDLRVNDASAVGPVAATNYTLSVPSGLSILANIVVTYVNTGSAGNTATVWTPGNSDPSGVAAAVTVTNISTSTGSTVTIDVWTNTSGQVTAKTPAASGNTLYLGTLGWLDRRGRDG